MIHKCSKHGLFNFGQGVPECIYCGEKLLIYCVICELWIQFPSHSHRRKNKYTEEYLLFVYFNDNISKIAIDKTCSINNLKRLICTNLKLNPSQYYLSSVDNLPCPENEAVFLHFFDYGFVILNKRNWINGKLYELYDGIVYKNDYQKL